MYHHCTNLIWTPSYPQKGQSPEFERRRLKFEFLEIFFYQNPDFWEYFFDKNLIFFTVNTEAAATVAKETLENVESTVNLERQISEDFVAAKESKKAATIAAIKRNQEVLELKVRILCFRFSLNPLRFSLTRETDTKLTRAKSWAICKTSIIEWQNLHKTPILTSAKWAFLQLK